MVKSFSELFSKSFKEYIINFKYYFLFVFLFSFIAQVVIFFLGYNLNLRLELLPETATFFEIWNIISSYELLVPLIIGDIISVLLSVFMTVSIIVIAFSNDKKQSFGEIINNAKKYFFRYLVLSILLFVFLIPLYILFIIPGIIFSVFWVFATLILVNENKKSIDSLKKSYNLVKGQWWKTFGYILLAYLIILLIMGIVSIVTFVVRIVLYSFDAIFLQLFVLIINFLGMVITTPLMILFMKNLYQDYSSGSQEKVKNLSKSKSEVSPKVVKNNLHKKVVNNRAKISKPRRK